MVIHIGGKTFLLPNVNFIIKASNKYNVKLRML